MWKKTLLLWADPWVEELFPAKSGCVGYESVVGVDDAQWSSAFWSEDLSIVWVFRVWFLAQTNEETFVEVVAF